MEVLQFNPEYKEETYWDHHILKLFDRKHVFVIPGAFQAEYVSQINERLAKEPYCVVIVSSDEMRNFPDELLNHPRMKVYVQLHSGRDMQIPNGTNDEPPKPLKKSIRFSFMGQVQNQERRELVDFLNTQPDAFVLESEGFTQGLGRDDYNRIMGMTEIVPCPGGNFVPDSFRLYEALEAGCTPVVLWKDAEYFNNLFGFVPFPIISKWEELPLVGYEDLRGWWNAHKNTMARRCKEDLEWLARQS